MIEDAPNLIEYAIVKDGRIENVIVIDVNHVATPELEAQFMAEVFGDEADTLKRLPDDHDVGIGDHHDEAIGFYRAQPYPSWTLQGTTWVPPMPMPEDDKDYYWDEEIKNWVAEPDFVPSPIPQWHANPEEPWIPYDVVEHNGKFWYALTDVDNVSPPDDVYDLNADPPTGGWAPVEEHE